MLSVRLLTCRDAGPWIGSGIGCAAQRASRRGHSRSTPSGLATALTPVTLRGMKNFTLALVITLLGVIALPSLAAEKPATEKKSKKTKAETARLFHVVSIKFKDTASKEQIKAVEDAFRDLKKKIPTIASMRWGTNVSPEKHDK